MNLSKMMHPTNHLWMRKSLMLLANELLCNLYCYCCFRYCRYHCFRCCYLTTTSRCCYPSAVEARR